MRLVRTATACLTMAFLLLATTPLTYAQRSRGGQRGKPIVLKAQKSTTRGGEDPNIKRGEEVNDPANRTQAPSAKGGPRTRGASNCEVVFDNWTPWYIKVYVDGVYRGTVGPYDDGVVYAIPGSTSVYGRSDFNDGSALTWGPQSYMCRPGQYIYFKMTE